MDQQKSGLLEADGNVLPFPNPELRFRKLFFAPSKARPDEYEARVGRYQTYVVWKPTYSMAYCAMNIDGGFHEGPAFADAEAAKRACQEHFERWVATTFFNLVAAEPEPAGKEGGHA